MTSFDEWWESMNRCQSAAAYEPCKQAWNAALASQAAPSQDRMTSYEAYKEHKRQKLEDQGFLKSPLRDAQSQEPVWSADGEPLESREYLRKQEDEPVAWINVSKGSGGHCGEYEWECARCRKVEWFSGYTDPNKEEVKCKCVNWTQEQISRERQHRHSMDQFKEVCKGTNCNASKAMSHHSVECEAEHEACHEAAPSQEPVAWQHRQRGINESKWQEWHTVGHKPQGPESPRFQMRPLFATTPPDAAAQIAELKRNLMSGEISLE